jgi:short subunit dehydrogenase-like uncharacterized protein
MSPQLQKGLARLSAGARAKKPLDVVVFGATGFCGRLVCAYLAAHYPSLKWAIAGRDSAKLHDVGVSLHNYASSATAAAADGAARFVRAGDTSPDCFQFDPAAALPRADASEASLVKEIVADTSQPASLDALMQETRLVITTVGPYAKYGAPLVAACAAAGVDYVDITGELSWIRKMIDQHDATAKQTGARIVSCGGFDSVPSDLAALACTDYVSLKSATTTQPLTLSMYATSKTRGGAPGGTLATVFNMMSKPFREMKATMKEAANPYSLTPERRLSPPAELTAACGGEAALPMRARTGAGACFDGGRYCSALPTCDALESTCLPLPLVSQLTSTHEYNTYFLSCVLT